MDKRVEQFQLTFFIIIPLRSIRKQTAPANKKFYAKEIIQEQTDPNLKESKKFLFILIYIQRGETKHKKEKIFRQ